MLRSPYKTFTSLHYNSLHSPFKHFISRLNSIQFTPLGHFGNYIRNTWKALKCGAGEGWRSIVPNVQEMKNNIKSREASISYLK